MKVLEPVAGQMPARPSLGSHRLTSLDPQLLWGLTP